MHHKAIWRKTQREIEKELLDRMKFNFIMVPSGIIKIENDSSNGPYTAAIITLEKLDIRREQNILGSKIQDED